MNAGASVRDVWFYRDAKKREANLVVQEGHVLYPVEIEAGSLIKAGAVKNFKCLEGMPDYEVGFGRVICQTNEPYYVARDVQAVPVWAILSARLRDRCPCCKVEDPKNQLCGCGCPYAPTPRHAGLRGPCSCTRRSCSPCSFRRARRA